MDDSHLFQAKAVERWLRPSQWKARSGEVAVHLNGQTAMRKEVRSEKRYEVKRGG
jgi:hypothetical protein